MRHLIRGSLGILFALGLSAGVASAETTAAQLVELARAGLDDDILIALIQTDGSTFQLTAADILALHRDGLSNRVIRAMQETARPTPAVPVQPDAPTPPSPPPVVNVYQTVTQKVESPSSRSYPVYSIPVAVPVYVPRVVQPHQAAPVYWGFGGQRRPDSWDDRTSRHQPDDSHLRKDGHK